MARLVFHPPPVTEARSAAFISLLITVILLFFIFGEFLNLIPSHHELRGMLNMTSPLNKVSHVTSFWCFPQAMDLL